MRIPKAQEIYRHFKGKLYQIVTVAEHTETAEQMVLMLRPEQRYARLFATQWRAKDIGQAYMPAETGIMTS